MPAYRAPIQDIGFLLNNVFDADSLFSSMPGTVEVTTDLTSAIVEEAGKIAKDCLHRLTRVAISSHANITTA